MKKLYILAALGAVATTTPSVANIASAKYVDDARDALETNIDTKLANTFDAKNSALTTNGTGAVAAGQIGTNMIAESGVTNQKVASGIGINKLDLPTKCASGSCMLIYDADAGKFTWEDVMRAGNESAPSGGVDGAGKNN